MPCTTTSFGDAQITAGEPVVAEEVRAGAAPAQHLARGAGRSRPSSRPVARRGAHLVHLGDDATGRAASCGSGRRLAGGHEAAKRARDRVDDRAPNDLVLARRGRRSSRAATARGRSRPAAWSRSRRARGGGGSTPRCRPRGRGSRIRSTTTSVGTSRSMTRSSGFGRRGCGRARAPAGSVRGKPSRTKPGSTSAGFANRSSTTATTSSSGTSSPRSMNALASRPAATPTSAESRNISPVERCRIPNCAASRSPWVPLPEPCLPSRTMRGPRGLRHRRLRRGIPRSCASSAGCRSASSSRARHPR